MKVTLFDIPIIFHWSSIVLFLILIPSFTMQGLLHGALFTVAVLFFLIGHELAHSLAARRFGYNTKNITIFALGGAAEVEGLNRCSNKETIIIAGAGPFFNFVCAFGLVVIVALLSALGITALIEVLSIAFFINMCFAIFNLIPGYPMDGGRILEAVLSEYLGKKTGQIWTKRISLFSGFAMIMAGFSMGLPMFVLIGLIVCFLSNHIGEI